MDSKEWICSFPSGNSAYDFNQKYPDHDKGHDDFSYGPAEKTNQSSPSNFQGSFPIPAMEKFQKNRTHKRANENTQDSSSKKTDDSPEKGADQAPPAGSKLFCPQQRRKILESLTQNG